MDKFNSIWYAAFVKTGDEDNVKKRIQYKFDDEIKIYVPKRKLRERKNGVWHEKIRTLFPGYVLIKGYIDSDIYYSIKNIPGLRSLLRDDEDILSISPSEINIINKLMCNGEIIKESVAIETDGRVMVLEGPLKGMEGRIVRIDKRKGRAKVNVSFLGEPRLVDLCINILSDLEEVG